MNLIYHRKYFKKSNSDWKDGDWYFEFKINNSDSLESFRETKLLNKANLKKGNIYKVKRGNNGYPVEVSWEGGKVYLKNNNSIIKVDKNGNETNLSIPRNKILGISNYNTAAINKFSKGILTSELLLKMNAKGKYFKVHYYDPQDRRKSGGNNLGFSRTDENYILIQKETQEEIDRDLKIIKSSYLNESIEQYFKIKTELLIPKKRRKK